MLIRYAITSKGQFKKTLVFKEKVGEIGRKENLQGAIVCANCGTSNRDVGRKKKKRILIKWWGGNPHKKRGGTIIEKAPSISG